MKYSNIFSPIKIRNLEIKNRIVMSAMHTLYTPDGFATERFNQYYWKRAEGGVGLVMVGGAAIDEYGAAYQMIKMDDDKYIPGYKEFTDGIHERGAKVGVQLFQSGRYSMSFANNGNQPIAPSSVYSGFSRETPREMTREDIDTVIRRFAEAAARAKAAGFDLVEISGSAGYLICQFLSPYTNKRTDEYGGSWENRLRFPRQVVGAVREAVGEDYPIGMRIAGHDLVAESNTNEDAVRFAKAMEDAGVDVLSVTGGWHESIVPQITAGLPRGGFDYMVAAVKKAVKIPVIACNRINDPAVAERLIAIGMADLAGVGRPNIADPEWCNKAEAGREDLIRRCLACNQGCLGRVFDGRPSECLCNGQAGREYMLKDLKKTEAPKRILVIGGGPAGCEFAIQAAQQGHQITLWEAEEKLGGQLHVAAVPPHKQEFYSLISYFENMLQEVGVEVVFGKEANVDSVKAAGFDVVVTAMGRGEAPQISLNITDETPVYTAKDILAGEVMAGKNVLVLGGGSVGCETAEYLAREASVSPEQVYHMMAHRYETPEKIYELINICYRNIALVDIKKIGSGFDMGTSWPVMMALKRFGVKMMPFTRVVEIGGGKAVLMAPTSKEDTTPREVVLPCDTVVMAVGSKPNDKLYNELIEAGIEAYNIGDSVKVSNALAGIRQACELAEQLAGITHEK